MVFASKVLFAVSLIGAVALNLGGCQKKEHNKKSSPAPKTQSSQDDANWAEFEKGFTDACISASPDFAEQMKEFCGCSIHESTAIYKAKYKTVQALPEHLELNDEEQGKVDAACNSKLPDLGQTDTGSDPVVTDPVVTDPVVTDPVITDPVIVDGFDSALVGKWGVDADDGMRWELEFAADGTGAERLLQNGAPLFDSILGVTLDQTTSPKRLIKVQAEGGRDYCLYSVTADLLTLACDEAAYPENLDEGVPLSKVN